MQPSAADQEAATGPVRKAVQKVLIETVINSIPRSESSIKALVVDRAALRILSFAMNQNELVNYGVSVIELLEIRREPLPSIPAIYLLTPTAETMATLSAESPKQYRSFHLFFTSHVSDYLMGDFKQNCKFVSKIRSFVEVKTRFLALESRFFSLDRPGASLPQLHAVDFGAGEMREELTNISDRLAEVCSLLAPSVEWNIRHDGMSFTARTLGSLVHEEMRDAMRKERMNQHERGSSGDVRDPDKSDETKPKRATLLIIDRVSDLVTPLFHDYTYQSMVHDFLPLNYRKPGGAHYELDENGEKKWLKVEDEDDDPVWPTVRSMFIQEAFDYSRAALQHFVENDAAYKLQRMDRPEIKEMTAAVRALPKSRMKADKHALHVQATKTCLEHVARTNLTSLALLEQDLIVGKAADGTKFKVDELVDRLISGVQTESVHDFNDRMRLFFLCLIVAEGMSGLADEASYLASSETFCSKMKRHATLYLDDWIDEKFSDENKASLQGLRRLLSIAHDGYTRLSLKINPDAPIPQFHGSDHSSTMSIKKFTNQLAHRQDVKRKRKQLKVRHRRHGLLVDGNNDDVGDEAGTQGQRYDVARYIPPLWGILMDLVDEELNKDTFPPTAELSVQAILTGGMANQDDEEQRSSSYPSPSSSTASRRKHFLRHFQGQGNERKMTKSDSQQSSSSSSSGASSSSLNQAGGRMADDQHLFMVFVVGGVTYSELHAVYDVCAKRQANIIIGATNVLTPANFLKSMAAIDDQVIRLRLMVPPLPLEIAVTRKAHLQNKQGDSFTPSVTSSAQAGSSNAADAQHMDDEFQRQRMDEDVIVVKPYTKRKGLKNTSSGSPQRTADKSIRDVPVPITK